jgi:acetyltransferase-like isoleucine patch superfamily enzyme
MKKKIDMMFYVFLDILAWFASLIIRRPVLDRMIFIINKINWHALKRQFAALGPRSSIASPFYIKNPRNVSIGNNFAAQPNFILEVYEEYLNDTFEPKVTIGNNVSFYHSCHVGCINRITIGDNVLFGSRVYISDHYHGNISAEDLNSPPAKRRLSSKGPVIIMNNVWVGDGVAIMPGVTIGENSIIGANSVVTKNIPANAVAAGVPARVIRVLNANDPRRPSGTEQE